MTGNVKTGLLAVAACVALSGCQSAYYGAWEKLGVEKRDILVDRVENAKESQEEAQEQFADALEEFSALINFNGGELEDVYDELNGEFQDSQAAAADVTARIDKVESVAEALFSEWEDELEKYDSDKLRRSSAEKLRATRRQYETMIKAMRKAESRMEPVLTALQDNVLYLKHNLNASAVGALEGELKTIQQDVSRLINEMKASVAESDAFIRTMKKLNDSKLKSWQIAASFLCLFQRNLPRLLTGTDVTEGIFQTAGKFSTNQHHHPRYINPQKQYWQHGQRTVYHLV